MESGVESVECGVWSVKYELWSVKVWSVESGVCEV